MVVNNGYSYDPFSMGALSTYDAGLNSLGGGHGFEWINITSDGVFGLGDPADFKYDITIHPDRYSSGGLGPFNFGGSSFGGLGYYGLGGANRFGGSGIWSGYQPALGSQGLLAEGLSAVESMQNHNVDTSFQLTYAQSLLPGFASSFNMSPQEAGARLYMGSNQPNGWPSLESARQRNGFASLAPGAPSDDSKLKELQEQNAKYQEENAKLREQAQKMQEYLSQLKA